MIELTEAQRQELATQPTEVLDPITNDIYVLVRKEVFERLQDLLDYDDGPWTDEEMDLLAAEDADSLGWEGMEAYQDDQA